MKKPKHLLLTIATIVITIISSCNCPIKRNDTDSSLSAKAPFPIGSAVGLQWFEKDSTMKALLKKEFNSITAENCMKPMYIHPEKNSFYWEDAEKLIAYCEENNVRLHGHTLIWHSQVPKWMSGFEGDSAAEEAMFKEHIQTIAGHFGEKVASWDVVNEALADSGGVMRPSFWLRLLGNDFVTRAFEYAHEVVPENTKLFYNDYSLESDSIKRKAALKMVDNMLERGIPIDGIGLQMHIRVDYPSISAIEETFRQFAQRGLLIHISELDISFNQYGKPIHFMEFTPEMAELQKSRYREVVAAYNNIVPPAQKYGITLWVFSDKYSWIRHFIKQPDWPTLYDDSLKRKPAWEGFAKGLKKV